MAAPLSKLRFTMLVPIALLVAGCAGVLTAPLPAPTRQVFTFPPTHTPAPSVTPGPTMTLVIDPSAVTVRPTAAPRPTVRKLTGPGKIAFVSDRSGKGDIYVMDPDGSNLRQITDSPDAEGYPVWSPDGQALAFVAWTKEGGGSLEVARIYSINADGTGRRMIIPDAGALFPAWSPDGGYLAYTTAGRIELAAFDFNRIQPFIWTTEANLRSPRWSSDGTLFTFASETLPAVARVLNVPIEKNIYIANGDSSSARFLVHGEMPSFSPDGTRIAFDANVGQYPQIFVINVDGSGLTQLTDVAGSNTSPDWSPDGSRIVFASTRDGNAEIYVMNADGSNQKRLTNNLTMDSDPAWLR